MMSTSIQRIYKDNRYMDFDEYIVASKPHKREQADIMALSIVLTEKVINNERLREVLAMHPADVTHLLQRLCKEDFLISSGRGRGTIYRIKDATLQAKDVTLQAKDTATLQAKDATLQDENTTTLQDDELNNNVLRLPTRMSKEQIQKAILEYCTEWRSVEDIANHVQRNKQYIRGEILPSMEQLLMRKYPLKERHPSQKYKVKED